MLTRRRLQVYGLAHVDKYSSGVVQEVRTADGGVRSVVRGGRVCHGRNSDEQGPSELRAWPARTRSRKTESDREWCPQGQ